MMVDNAFAGVLDEYRQKGEQEAAWIASATSNEVAARSEELLLHVGEAPAEFLRSLVIAHNAQLIVELGTSLGFSTLFLADAARQTGGRVVTFELSEKKQAFARDQLKKAGLARFVDWRLGDAVKLIGTLEANVDFAFVDLWKDLYVPCFHALLPKLKSNAIVAADNMRFPEFARTDAEAYRAAVRAQSDFTSVLLPIGQGIELSCRSTV